jgi:hypothetical protein
MTHGMLRVVTSRTRSTLLATVAACGLGCAAAPEKTATLAFTPAPAPALTASAGASEEWSCTGALVPPTGWQPETAFRPATAPNARQGASDDASNKLRDRVCAGQDACDFLQSRIRGWKTGSNGTVVCAMAVVSTEDLEAWRQVATSTRKLDDSLAAAAKELLGSKPGRTVALDSIRDMGVPGGLRAEWLKARMERQLQKYAAVVGVPRGWAGDGVPPRIDVVVSAVLVERTESQVPVVESNWSAVSQGGGRRGTEPVLFPRAAAPPFAGTVVEAPRDTPGLSLRIESPRAGSLCAGERTQIWVRSETTVHARVVNLYGDGEGLIAFPNVVQPNDLVPAGQTVPLGDPRGFEAVPAPGSEYETFLVIAAADPQDLGRFRDLKGTCKLPRDLARQLQHGAGLPPGVRHASTGYRLVSGPECSQIPQPNRQGVAESLPDCKL